MKIHIFGASGSGTTTLGIALADKLKIRHFDTDYYFWIKTDPPFQHVRSKEERASTSTWCITRTSDGAR